MVNYTRSNRFALALCLVTAALSHGCLMSVDAEFPEVDVVRSFTFDGVPANTGEGVLTQSYDVVSKDLNLPKELESEFHPTEAVLVAGEGTGDLSFIRTMTLTMNSDVENEATPGQITVIDYERPDGAGVISELHAPCNESVDISRASGQKSVFTLRMTGVMPEHRWSAGLTVHLHGHVRFQP